MLLGSVLVSRRRAHGFYASLHLARCIIIPAQSMKRQPVAIAPFRIRRALVDKSFECHTRIFVLGGFEVRVPYLAPHFVLAVLRVAGHHCIEVIDCISEPAFLARNAAELIMSVGLFRVDLDRSFEARLGLFVLAALLVDQPKVVMRRSVGRVQRGGLEIALEVFTCSLCAYHIAQ